MKKFLFLSVACVCCMNFVGVYAVQILLLNKTGKSVVLSLKFFHPEAKKEMVIRDFTLGSLEKTKFPQDKDMGLAQPTKLKIKTADGVSVSTTFDQNDTTVHDLEIIEYEGSLKLSQKKPVETSVKKILTQ